MTLSLSYIPVNAAETTSDSGWNYALAPMFLWGMSIDGSSTVGPSSLPLKLDFKDDVLSNMSAAFTLHFEAQKDDLTWLAEIQYAELEPTSQVGPIKVNVNYKSITGALLISPKSLG